MDRQVLVNSLQTHIRLLLTGAVWWGSTLFASLLASFGCISLQQSHLIQILVRLQQIFWVSEFFFLVFTVSSAAELLRSHMPYLTLWLWDKISQNLAHLEASSHKIFKSHRIFRPSFKTFYEEINIHHTLLCLSQASYIIIKAFDSFGGASKWFL